ncbi:hypothetical protein GP486_000934 [Trichoglossum hirsutum]|uniref:C2H2-type domain-containing protein n=1 Tax=Trichoglossum hirsutum TaxID=265104 RepID=A0A9P8RT35_9PEZI|nr:hypothetical protein GP486_000934 [Trichoglossum hirsutum]
MDPFHHYPEYRVLVCKSCQYAIQPTQIVAHLRSDQHKLSRSQSEELADKYKNIQLIDPRTEQIAPTIVITPIHHLPIYRDGLACNHCHFICRSRDWIQRHQREVHNIKIGRGRKTAQIEWTTVWCQRFFTGVGRHFFQVQQTNQSDESWTDTSTQLRQLVYRQLEQKERTVQKKRQLIRDAEDSTEVSPWLERTQWIRHLEGQDRAAIAQLVKPADTEELEFQEMEKSVKRLVEKARQTILQKKVSTFTLHRVQSFQTGQDAEKPFHVNMDLDTLERYQRVWMRLLVYVLRTVDLDSRLYQLTQDQQSCIQSVKLAASRFQMYKLEELEEEEAEAMQKEMDKYCLKLCIALLDHRLDHNEYESAIISYFAVAALEHIHDDGTGQYRFKDSGEYTPILSGYIKVAQMLTVQYCLEQEEDHKQLQWIGFCG